MKVLVCGGRDYTDRDKVYQTLHDLYTGGKSGHNEPLSMVIHGGASGADALAGEWARLRGVAEVCVPANWKVHGRSAGPLRNHWMLELRPDMVVAFPGGYGTAHMVKIARSVGIPVVQL